MPSDAIELTMKSTAGGATDDTVTLPYALRQKSRQRLRLDGGREAALVLTPGTFLDDGDRLESADGYSVRVCAAREPVSQARTHDPLRLARACYHLGNRHVALQVGDGWVRYLPDHVLDDMVRGLDLVVTASSERFEPERGAYAHGHGGGHATHGHAVEERADRSQAHADDAPHVHGDSVPHLHGGATHVHGDGRTHSHDDPAPHAHDGDDGAHVHAPSPGRARA